MATRAQVVPGSLEGAQRVGRALADTGRLRILAAIAGRELCVCHLVDLLELDASTVSRHVRLLRDAGLVAVRKEGRWLHCRRAGSADGTRAALWTAIDALITGAPELERDEARLRSANCAPDDCC